MASQFNYSQILASLRQKRQDIEEAILALERIVRGEGGQPASSGSTSIGAATATGKRRGRPPGRKNRISVEGRRRIAEATRRRWAAKRAAAKKATPRAKKSA